jgi:hypothetical protein
MLSEKIIGVWELQIWETVVDDKVVGYPLGENASGFIAYHPIGFMSGASGLSLGLGRAGRAGNGCSIRCFTQ